MSQAGKLFLLALVIVAAGLSGIRVRDGGGW
jgi:hypothetical protein